MKSFMRQLLERPLLLEIFASGNTLMLTERKPGMHGILKDAKGANRILLTRALRTCSPVTLIIQKMRGLTPSVSVK